MATRVWARFEAVGGQSGGRTGAGPGTSGGLWVADL